MVKPLVAFLVATLSTSCALFPAGRAQKTHAIELLIKADPQLNKYQDNSHSLLLCLYQLKDPNRFRQLAGDARGASKLFECGRFDESVVDAGQLIVQPGQEVRQVRDFGEGTRYLGVVGGYYTQGKRRVADLVPISLNGGAPSSRMVRIELGPHEIGAARAE